MGCALLAGCGKDVTDEREWAAYRGFHDSFAQFKNDQAAQRFTLLRMRLMVWPRQPNLPVDGLSLELVGAATRTKFSVDPLGGVELPLQPRAYAEDAVLRLDQPRGQYGFSIQYSVQVRPDRRYTQPWLREACAQGLEKIKEFGLSDRLKTQGKQCVGVVFKFRQAHLKNAPLVFEAANGALSPLQPTATPFFGNDAADLIGTVQLRFADWPSAAQLLAREQPGVIDFIVE